MQLAQTVLLAAFLLLISEDIADAATSPSSGTIACDRVALGSRSSTKWTVSCISEDSATASSAYFNPTLVNNYYVNSGRYVAPSSSDLNLSSTFSEVDALVSTSTTKFSLSAAPGYTPTVPVNIVSTAFSELSALQTLYLAGIPLANNELHLVLPTSIQHITILDCGLSTFSFEFADGSAIVDSAISSINLRHNALDEVPTSLFSLPNSVSTIDLRGNDNLTFESENSAHEEILATWIDDEVLHANNITVVTLDTSNQEERNSIAGSGTTNTKSNSDILLPTSSSGSNEKFTSTRDGNDMDAIPITIVAVVVPAVLALGITLAFIIRKRKRMQDRETDAILELPHPFDKTSRDRSETSGNFTLADSELSRSRMSVGDSHYHDDRDSCVVLAVTPTGSGESTQQPDTTQSFSAGYVNLGSPQDSHHGFIPTNKRRQISRRGERDSSHSLELLGTLSTASATPAQTRLAARKALLLALETLVEAKPNGEGTNTQALLTVNTHQYSFSPSTQIEETPLAFFIDCRLSTSSTEESSVTHPPSKFVLKIFIEDDADLAGRESYALSCLQHDESTRVFAPRVHDIALEYELVPKTSDAVKQNCCILVLEMPSCTTLRAHMAVSREPKLQQISRVANAVQALHSRGLVHGALHVDSLVACSPDARLKFWGLESVSRAGHTLPSPDVDVQKVFQAECVAPELASVALEKTLSIRASPSLDVWSLGVMILKLYASGQPLEEFKGCASPRDVFERLNASDLDGKLCFFERSIAQFVPDTDMEDLLRQCLQCTPNSRPSIDLISNHSLFQRKEREVCRPITVKSAAMSRMLSAIIEEKDLTISGEPERETSGTEQPPEKIEDKVSEPDTADDLVPEPLPPSLWLFLPPVELEIDLTQRASFYSVEQWVSRLKRLQQQRGGELRFPLVFMCETCESNATVQCSVATTSKYGTTVTESLLCLVMPLVRETMLFLEARAILSNGLSVGEVSGLIGPQQWEELQSFYCALERMELATLNPVNEMELAPLEKQLKTRDPAKAQLVLDDLTQLIFSSEKREYVRNLLDALVSDEAFTARVERSSWATLRRCDVTGENSSTMRRTRWLCSHHAPQKN